MQTELGASEGWQIDPVTCGEVRRKVLTVVTLGEGHRAGYIPEVPGETWILAVGLSHRDFVR